MPKKLIILLLGLGICLITFFLVNAHMGKTAARQKALSQPIRVIVAKIPIEARTAITAEMLEYKEIPKNYAAPGAATNHRDVLDRISLSPIIAGEQIISAKLIKNAGNVGLPLVIPENKRAVSVQVDSAASVANMVKPGDMVDIVCVVHDWDRTIAILQNVQVLAIDQQVIESSSAPNQSKLNTTVIATFALSLSDAEKLIQASNKGALKLLLRPLNDNSSVISWGATTSKLLPYTAAAPAQAYSVRVINGAQVSSKSL
ncbi:MAG: Flp pilus assembly protein CpaB [Candidatus Margulisbacteria bacterium]|jgi:pilus assembly protein CpaB|nr:Flp pilus assembly protein CpaB [Candidatus Margulisiibacteriota bacterium]